MRLTNSEKRRAVTVALNDPEWSLWSNMEIARRCGVGETLVRSLRAERSEDGPRTYLTRHGTVATMDVSRIGRDRDIEERPGPVVEEPYRMTPAPDLIVAYAEIVRERETAQQAAQAERPVATRQSHAGNKPGVTATVARDLGLGKATVKRALARARREERAALIRAYAERLKEREDADKPRQPVAVSKGGRGKVGHAATVAKDLGVTKRTVQRALAGKKPEPAAVKAEPAAAPPDRAARKENPARTSGAGFSIPPTRAQLHRH